VTLEVLMKKSNTSRRPLDRISTVQQTCFTSSNPDGSHALLQGKQIGMATIPYMQVPSDKVSRLLLAKKSACLLRPVKDDLGLKVSSIYVNVARFILDRWV